MTREERFFSKVKYSDGCWEWCGYVTVHGYGQYTFKKKTWKAHRLSYQTWVGPLDPTKEIDHLCRNRKCINPKHLEQVTKKENILRGISPPAKNSRKTHCPNGHKYTIGNIKNKCRVCRICKSKYDKILYKKVNSAPKLKSKYRGVGWDPKGKWRVTISYKNKNRHVGMFENEIEAAKAYDAQAIKLHGSNAIVNFKLSEWREGQKPCSEACVECGKKFKTKQDKPTLIYCSEVCFEKAMARIER